MTEFNVPPQTTNAEGKIRRTGFEFELAGLNPEECANLIKEHFGGRINKKHSLEVEILDTALGEFKVELDSRIVKDLASRLEEEKQSSEPTPPYIHEIREYFSGKIGALAGLVVPLEIITPPLTIKQFSHMERLREELHRRKAEGTKTSITNAFGMHINPDIPTTDMNYIKEVLRAFLLLYPWLKGVMKVDLSRRLLPFIDPFPHDYIKLILPSTYVPTANNFIDDYLYHNPTRNRALDLLPIFADFKPEALNCLENKIRSQVKARPAFHYRLPNYEVDDSDWTIAGDWNYWVEVETLAEDEEKLNMMAEDYLIDHDRISPLHEQNWLTKLSTRYGYVF